jgi:hypothetical protein
MFECCRCPCGATDHNKSAIAFENNVVSPVKNAASRSAFVTDPAATRPPPRIVDQFHRGSDVVRDRLRHELMRQSDPREERAVGM